MTIPTPTFSNDRPLLSKSEDRLNRAPFADRVAGVLRALPSETGLVVGIHGPWGDGKTTVLNLLRSDLQADENTVVREFNPWRLSDDESVLRGFFGMLAEAINKSLATKSEEAKIAAAKWTKRFGWVFKLLGFFWKPAASVDELLAKLGKLAASGDTIALDTLRSRISEHLRLCGKRIIILVDDIDRLDKHEMHMMFRLIKACADFPNVCYVLAFDDIAVAKTLGDRYGPDSETSGRAFLEKIIQVPLKLPVAMREDLRSLCFQQVDRALAAEGVELAKEDAGEFVSGFDRAFANRLDTPRAAKRFGNGLQFALPMLRGEVNMADLLLIEAVRAFYPAIYDIIRASHDEFSGVESKHGRTGQNSPGAGALLKPLVEALPADEQEAIKLLLASLFPRLGSSHGRNNFGSDGLASWSQSKRICSPEYCPRYFSYSVPTSDVRDSAMDALYSKAGLGADSQVSEIIRAYFTSGKAKRVIERMRQREERTSSEEAPSLCLAVATNAKHIPNPPSLFGFAEPVSQAGILISHLIRRLPTGPERMALAKQVIEAADPLWFGGEVLRWLYVTDDAGKAASNTLTKEETEAVVNALVERIKVRATAGESLLSSDIPQEVSLLLEWSRVEGRQPVQAYLTSAFMSDPKSIGLFLKAMAPRIWGQGDIFPQVGELRGDQLKIIKLIFDLDALADLIRKHLPGDFKNPQWFPESNKQVELRLAEQFMFIYEKWKTDGESLDTHTNDDGASLSRGQIEGFNGQS